MAFANYGMNANQRYGGEQFLRRNFNTIYTRYPYSSVDRSENFIPHVRDSVNTILSKVHSQMKPIPNMDKTDKKKTKTAGRKVVLGYKPTDEEIRSIEVNAERLRNMDYKQRKAILDKETQKVRLSKAKNAINPYDIIPFMPNKNPETYREKPTIAQLKASVMMKKHLNKRRHDPIYDWEAANYRREKQFAKLTASRNMMEEMLNEFERLKDNHENLSQELNRIQSNLVSLDDRLTDKMLGRDVAAALGTEIKVENLPTTSKGYKRKVSKV